MRTKRQSLELAAKLIGTHAKLFWPKDETMSPYVINESWPVYEYWNPFDSKTDATELMFEIGISLDLGEPIKPRDLAIGTYYPSLPRVTDSPKVVASYKIMSKIVMYSLLSNEDDTIRSRTHAALYAITELAADLQEEKERQ